MPILYAYKLLEAISMHLTGSVASFSGDQGRQSGQSRRGYDEGHMLRPLVQTSPSDILRRRLRTWHGMAAEAVQLTCHELFECRFGAPSHLLVAYEQGERRDGETSIEGLPPSRLRDLAQKFTFVPAGHEYREWHEPLALPRLMYVYID